MSALVGLLLCMVVASASAQTATNITAYFFDYNPQKICYNYHNVKPSEPECTEWDAEKPLCWRCKYDWTAYGGPVPPIGQETCGKCLKFRVAFSILVLFFFFPS